MVKKEADKILKYKELIIEVYMEYTSKSATSSS
jgi:hypothetical protein